MFRKKIKIENKEPKIQESICLKQERRLKTIEIKCISIDWKAFNKK